MADKDFRIDLILGAKFAEAFRALDDAKRKIGEVEKSAGKFSRGTGNAVGTALRATAVAGVAAATAAVGVMSLYIAKTIEAEKVQAQLQSRLKATGGVAGRTLEQLNDTAGKLQNLTVFDDEAIGGVQAMLLTFKEIRGLQLDRATASVLDLSTAMGTDLNSAALQLGKALNDPVKGLTALSRAGVQFSTEQTALIKSLVETGQKAKAQDIILAELEGQMGGAAEAARDTLGGALQALKNSFDNVLEGDAGDAGIKGTRAAIESLIDTLNDPDVKRGVDAVIGGMVGIAAAAVDVIGKTGQALSALRELFAANDKKSTISLQNKRTDLESELFSIGRKSGIGYRAREQVIRQEIAEIDAIIARQAKARSDQLAAQGVDASFDFILQPGDSTAPRTPPSAKKPKTGGSKADPDADIKRRIASLKEEAALLGAVAEGEDKASEAAKVRYAITEGEFKNKSPQLKAELLAAAEALDAKNRDREAEEKRKEAIEKSREAYQDLLRELRTPAQVAVDDAIAKLNTLSAAIGAAKGTGATQADVDAATQKIVSGAFDKAPGVGFQDFNPFDQFEQDRQQLEAWYTTQLSMLATFRQQRADLNAQWDAQEQQIEAQHQAALQQLQFAQSQMMLGAASSMFGSLAEIARAGVGEQSKAYRVLFAISKGFAIAQAATSLAINVAKASEKGFPQNLPLIAAAFAQGAQIVAILSGANYNAGGSGYAEGGYTGPGGKYQPAGIVHKGEGVLTQEEITALGGPSGFYRLREMIDDGALRERMYGWAGYAAGGLVGAPTRALPPPDYASFPQGGAGMTGRARTDMNLYLLHDRDALAQAVANHPAMKEMVVAEVSENGNKIRASWEN